MSITLVDANAGLFNALGKAVHSINTLNVARLTTIPTEVTDFILQYKKNTGATIDFDKAMASIPAANSAWQSSGATLAGTLAQAMRDLIIEYVNADAEQPKKDITSALEYLIADMLDQDYYVDANAVGASLAADAGNSSTDLTIVYTTLRGDGRACENLLAEDIAVEVTSAASALTPTVRFLGQRAATDPLGQDWPLGSGCNTSISATDAAASLLDNGDFQDESANLANMPDKWIAGVGTPGTHFLLTDPEVQTVILAGSPASGQYFLQWNNPDGINRATVALAFNAGGDAVQAALRLIPGLEAVTVVTTGSSPNYTHTITFTGVAGNINQLTSLSQINTGTISHATTTAGVDESYKGAGLKILGDGSTAVALYLPIGTIDAETVYAIHFRHKKSGTPGAGTIRLAIVDAVGGSVTTDLEGNANSATYDLTAGTVTTSFASGSFTFRLKKTQTQPVYLQIIETVALANTYNYFIDEIGMVACRELYRGGPFAAAFSGKTPAVEGDKWVLTTTNDRAGSFQTAFQRAFDMTGKGLLLPIAGSTGISDSLIG